MSFPHSPVCIPFSTLRVLRLCVSLVTTPLFAAGYHAWWVSGMVEVYEKKTKSNHWVLTLTQACTYMVRTTKDKGRKNRGHKITGTFWLFPGLECLNTMSYCASPLFPALLCRAQCPSASTRSVLDHSGVLSPMNLKRYMFCVLCTSPVLSLYPSLEPV